MIQQTCQRHPCNPVESLSGLVNRATYGNIYEEAQQGGLKQQVQVPDKKISIEMNKTNGKLVNKISACTISKSLIKQFQITNPDVQGILHRGPMQNQLQPPPLKYWYKLVDQENQLQHDENIKRKPQYISLHKHVWKIQFQKYSIATNRKQSHD